MKKLVLLLIVTPLFIVSSVIANPESYLGKFDWEEQLSEAQKTNTFEPCQQVVVAAYLDKNEKVFNKAVDVCWPIGKNAPGYKIHWDYLGVQTKEDYIKFVETMAKGKEELNN